MKMMSLCFPMIQWISEGISAARKAGAQCLRALWPRPWLYVSLRAQGICCECLVFKEAF